MGKPYKQVLELERPHDPVTEIRKMYSVSSPDNELFADNGIFLIVARKCGIVLSVFLALADFRHSAGLPKTRMIMKAYLHSSYRALQK